MLHPLVNKDGKREVLMENTYTYGTCPFNNDQSISDKPQDKICTSTHCSVALQ